MTTATKITLVRVALIPLYMVFMYLSGGCSNLWMWLGLAVFIIASITDYIDGQIARKFNQVSDFGKFLDPLADKLLVCSALICFVATKQLPAWMVIVIIAREFIISGFRLIASDEGVVIAASYWGKVKTTVQIIMIIALIIEFPYALIIAWIAVILTVVSLVDYIVKNIQVIKKGGM